VRNGSAFPKKSFSRPARLRLDPFREAQPHQSLHLSAVPERPSLSALSGGKDANQDLLQLQSLF